MRFIVKKTNGIWTKNAFVTVRKQNTVIIIVFHTLIQKADSDLQISQAIMQFHSTKSQTKLKWRNNNSFNFEWMFKFSSFIHMAYISSQNKIYDCVMNYVPVIKQKQKQNTSKYKLFRKKDYQSMQIKCNTSIQMYSEWTRIFAEKSRKNWINNLHNTKRVQNSMGNKNCCYSVHTHIGCP